MTAEPKKEATTTSTPTSKTGSNDKPKTGSKDKPKTGSKDKDQSNPNPNPASKDKDQQPNSGIPNTEEEVHVAAPTFPDNSGKLHHTVADAKAANDKLRVKKYDCTCKPRDLTDCRKGDVPIWCINGCGLYWSCTLERGKYKHSGQRKVKDKTIPSDWYGTDGGPTFR